MLLGSATVPDAAPADVHTSAERPSQPQLPYEFAALAWPAVVSTPKVEPASTAAAEPPPADRGVRILVSLPQQKAWVFDDGKLVDSSPVSTGKRGYATPAGTFPILQKKVHHRSNKYSNAPMPYMQRLTWSGVALHAGHVPGYPASHGCIRFPRKFAKRLYGLTDFGTKVIITRQSARSAQAALALIGDHPPKLRHDVALAAR
ncbi:MAG TPA: L,D-transpeptidase family protein [Allosphingosinicella sp.]|uniref:L,D-transpeptidase family protein n=1 Tax=Allosphingosinicella sp. TaxID=2823234 RepID=UPI002F2AF7D8